MVSAGTVASASGARATPGCEAGPSVTFTATGSEQCYPVAAGVHAVSISAIGAAGGDVALDEGPGGLGGTASGTVPVTPGQILYVEVGGPGLRGRGTAGGFNGGGDGNSGDAVQTSGAGGGGASDVRTVSAAGADSLDSRLVVAAGGGGGGGGGSGGGGDPAGYGADSGASCGGLGATLTAGGAGGQGPCTDLVAGQDGALGQGGDGAHGPNYGGGGGGGGYYGGGGGTYGNGGGGGSDYVAASATDVHVGVNLADLAPKVTITARHDVQTFTWTGNAGDGDWGTSGNWSPNGVPADGDSVVLDNTAGANNISQIPEVSLVDLTLAEGPDAGTTYLRGSGPVTVTGRFSWNGGELGVPLQITAGATGTVSGSNGRINELSENLTVAGRLTLHDATGTGALSVDDPHTLHVLPTGELDTGVTSEITSGSCCVTPATVVNDGSVHVSGRQTLRVEAVVFRQDGTISFGHAGRVLTSHAPVTSHNGRYDGSGRWTIAPPATARFTGTQTIGRGADVELGGLHGDSTATLGGTFIVRGAGHFDWTGGTIEANATIARGMHVRVNGKHTGNGSRLLSGQDTTGRKTVAATVTNHGSITVSGGGAFATAGRARLVNAADGTMSLDSGTQLHSQLCCVHPDRITNAGALRISAARGSTAQLSGISFQDAGGTIAIAAGRTLALTGPANVLRSATVTGGGQLTIAGDTSVSRGPTVASGSRIALASGTLSGETAVRGRGGFTWSGGRLRGTITLATTGGIRVTGRHTKAIANRGNGRRSTVTFRGPVTFASGTRRVHNTIDLGHGTLTLAGSAHVGSFVAFRGGRLANNAHLYLPDAPLHVDGAYIQASHAALVMHAQPSAHSVLTVGRSATVHGRLVLHNARRAPWLGSSITVITTSGPLRWRVSCVTTSGSGASSRHWRAHSHAHSIVLEWSRGAHRHC